MLRRSFKFKGHETRGRPKDKADERAALVVGTVVTLICWYTFHWGGSLFVGLGAYVWAHYRLARKR